MADKTAQRMGDLLTLYKTTLLDLPLAGTKRGLGMGQEKDVVEAAWKGYDAWVRLANASMDDLYRNPLFGDLLARSLDGWLRWQRLSQAMAGAFFAALWPAVGLPTAAALQALHEDLQSLDTHVKTQDAAVRTLRAELQALATLRQELPSVTTTTGHSTQRARETISIELAKRHMALPAQRNGDGNGTTHNGNGATHNGTRALLQKKLANGHAANGHGIKDRRKGDAVTA